MEKQQSVSVQVYSQTGEKLSKLSLNGEVFGIEPHQQVMFDAIQVYLANMRQATAKTKKRDEVSGGGKKPWRQKGTGRARAGSTRSPIWVGGGTVFGPDGQQNYKISQNKKAHNLALRSAYSMKAKDGLMILDDLKITAKKTKEMINVLKTLGADKKVLLVVDEADENIIAASCNIRRLVLTPYTNVSVFDLMHVDHVIVTKSAIKKIEEALS